MALLNVFLQKICTLFGINDVTQVLNSGDHLSIGSKSLPLIDIFFRENGTRENTDSQLELYLNQFEIKPGSVKSIHHKNDSTNCFHIVKLHVLNENIQHGFFELTESDGTRIGFVFTGKFAGSIDQPDLTGFPEAIFAICVLDADSTLNEITGWEEVFEAIGPFAVCHKENVLQNSLAEYGIFTHSPNTFMFSWDNLIASTLRPIKHSIPHEAQMAYVAALKQSNSPDIALVNLYRTFEVLFAVGLKDKILQSAPNDVIKIFRDLKSLSELDMLSTLLEQSHVSFTHFTLTDFCSLFGTHKPEDKYRDISAWFTANSSQRNVYPPNDLRAKIIYYIRCSLVHSKLGEKEPFLIGPYTNQQTLALSNIIEDIRSIIKSLIY
jgi:hypothetical protein